MQNKHLELDCIEYELDSIRKSRIKLIKLLSKKKRKDEHEKILSETLKLGKEQEQQLLNQRDKIQKTIST